MKRTLLIIISFTIVFLCASAGWYYTRLHAAKKQHTGSLAIRHKKTALRLNEYGDKLLRYARQHHYNSRICFLIDMQLASGENRFFIYDLQKDSVLDAGLVTHGRCNKTWLNGRQYGNKVGCGCTSLGKYKIGNAYKGRFGLAYKLHGLDSSNSNAYKRYVVLHSHECVPEAAVNPYPICQSDGCPTVSPGFLTTLSKVIDTSSKPVLLWIFDN